MKIINKKTNLIKKLLYTLISLNSNIFEAYNQRIKEIEETNNELSLKKKEKMIEEKKIKNYIQNPEKLDLAEFFKEEKESTKEKEE